MKLFRTIAISTLLLFAGPSWADEDCVINDDVRSEILKKISAGEKNILDELNQCYSLDRKLILRASLLDYKQFQYADKILKTDESFVYRLIRVSPNILQFVSADLLNDPNFMKQATYLYRDALQYANPRLLDNKMFMSEMVKIDSRNYMFASERIKGDVAIATTALSDNGILLSSAPEAIKSNKNLVKIAIESSVLAFASADSKLQKDKQLLALVKSKTPAKTTQYLTSYIIETYTAEEPKADLGILFTNRTKFSAKDKIIDRNYVTKWQRKFLISKDKSQEELRLIAADKRNYPIIWKEDFKKYPDLIEKIQNFFLRHNIDQNTIDNLSTTFFWQVEANPLTFVFNLYLMRDSQDVDLGPEFSNVTSLTAIVQKQKSGWKMSVVEVIFDNEIKVDVAFENGHKRYVFWDIINDNKNPQIIFKVEDKFKNHFEIFTKQSGGKYSNTSRIDVD